MRVMLLDSGSGLIPFVKEIVRMDKRNTYYLFMDHEFFPYGEKSPRELRRRLRYLLKRFEHLDLDLLLICCNTLSNIYLRMQVKTSFRVKTILSLNLEHLNASHMLVTPNLKRFYKKDDRFVSCHLAESIEREDFKNLIEEIRSFSFEGKVILGCTHYPLAKNLFRHYCAFDTVSYENEFIAKLRQDHRMIFYGRDYEREIFRKYFPDMDILAYHLT